MKWASIPSQTTVEVLSYPECPLPIIKRRGYWVLWSGHRCSLELGSNFKEQMWSLVEQPTGAGTPDANLWLVRLNIIGEDGLWACFGTLDQLTLVRAERAAFLS